MYETLMVLVFKKKRMWKDIVITQLKLSQEKDMFLTVGYIVRIIFVNGRGNQSCDIDHCLNSLYEDLIVLLALAFPLKDNSVYVQL